MMAGVYSVDCRVSGGIQPGIMECATWFVLRHFAWFLRRYSVVDHVLLAKKNSSLCSFGGRLWLVLYC